MTDQAERFLLAAANDFEGMTVAEIKAQLASVVPQVIQYGNAICRAERRIDALLHGPVALAEGDE